ncbi:MAG TPA: dTMP kinase, partial [Sulfurihydrogenibium azorense]|nr:dTMP kinase [Sulfurihydrogenibium azorense]
IENESLDFHRKVREGFLIIAEKEKDRFIILDATKSPDDIFQEVLKALKERKVI